MDVIEAVAVAISEATGIAITRNEVIEVIETLKRNGFVISNTGITQPQPSQDHK